MEEAKKGTTLTAESLVGRFRSKQDLHKYLTQHCNVFLPSLRRTTVSFLRDILNEKKLHLKSSEVIHLDVPFYQEISVLNIYEDAMGDEQLSKYLPSREQVSNRLPERRFFFGVLSTLKRQYLSDIISAAHAHRYKAEQGEGRKEGIIVSDHWQAELLKHPYYSSKSIQKHSYRKARDCNFSHEGESKGSQASSRQIVICCSEETKQPDNMTKPKPEKRLKHPPQSSLVGARLAK